MKTGTRRAGRELALKIIYSLQDQERDIRSVLDDFWANFRFNDDVLGEPLSEVEEPLPAGVKSFAEILSEGVVSHLEEIDKAIDSTSTNWSLDRMARVDLSLLRLATYELLFLPDIPSSVIINEAIEIGKRYGSKETPSFINGILDKITKNSRQESK